MKIISKSKVANFYAESQSKLSWTVISFNPVTRVRELACGNFSFIFALDALTVEGAKGNLVILTDKEGWEAMKSMEEENHARVTFEQMKPYKKAFSAFSMKVRNASYF